MPRAEDIAAYVVIKPLTSDALNSGAELTYLTTHKLDIINKDEKPVLPRKSKYS